MRYDANIVIIVVLILMTIKVVITIEVMITIETTAMNRITITLTMK